MLKTRVIPVLLLKNGLIVRSESFKYHQIIGDPTTQLRRYDSWQVDELIYLDISQVDAYDVRRSDAKIATSGKTNVLDIISEIAKVCFVPLTFGGRIRSLQDIRDRLDRGADKVTLNTLAHNEPNLVSRASNMFGSQCIVISIDAYRLEDGTYEVYRGGRRATGVDPVAWAKEMERQGAGEILLNSMNRDGVACGYDLSLVKNVSDAVSVPVIALGGVGHWKHMAACLQETRVAAVAAANKFHFTEMSYRQAKDFLLANDCVIRSPTR